MRTAAKLLVAGSEDACDDAIIDLARLGSELVQQHLRASLALACLSSRCRLDLDAVARAFAQPCEISGGRRGGEVREEVVGLVDVGIAHARLFHLLVGPGSEEATPG